MGWVSDDAFEEHDRQESVLQEAVVTLSKEELCELQDLVQDALDEDLIHTDFTAERRDKLRALRDKLGLMIEAC